MDKTPTIKKTSRVTILSAVVIAVVIVNILFIVFTVGAGRTVKLLKQEAVAVEQQERLISSSQNIFSEFREEIDIIADVFPNEETIAVFVQTIEGELRAATPEYTFRFTAVTPIREQDRLYLPLTITMRVSLAQLTAFLARWERLPYMLHITGISAKTPVSFTDVAEVMLSVKVYVQNPFTP